MYGTGRGRGRGIRPKTDENIQQLSWPPTVKSSYREKITELIKQAENTLSNTDDTNSKGDSAIPSNNTVSIPKLSHPVKPLQNGDGEFEIKEAPTIDCIHTAKESPRSPMKCQNPVALVENQPIFTPDMDSFKIPKITFELPKEKSWVHTMEGKLMYQKFFHFCLSAFWEGKQTNPYKICSLPLPSAYQKMKPYMLSVCHVTSYKNPWEFHAIFESSEMIDYGYENPSWCEFFATPDNIVVNYLFKSPLQLYHGMSTLLCQFKSYLDIHPELLQDFTYEIGDLVCFKSAKKIDGEFKVFGLRGVIVKKVWRKCKNVEDSEPEQCFSVYHLDTGVDSIVPLRYLKPLPKPFIGFPPMAIKCSLREVSPIGPFWNETACLRMAELLRPDVDKKLFAEVFEADKTDPLPEKDLEASTSTASLVSDLLSTPAFFVTIRSTADFVVGAVNVSTQLVRERLGVRWSLYPHRRHVRAPQPHSQPSDKQTVAKNKKGLATTSARFPPGVLDREAASLLFDESPNKLSMQLNENLEQALDFDMYKIFNDNPNWEAQLVDVKDDDEEDDENILVLTVDDGEETLDYSSVSQFFLND